MLKKLSSHQLSEWMAFSSMEPFGFEGNLYGHALTTSMIANVNRKKGVRAKTPQDFMPQPEEQTELPEERSFFSSLKSFLFTKG